MEREDQKLFAGIDVSTQGCKIAIIEPEEGEVLYIDSVNYDNDLPRYNTRDGVLQGLEEGVAESDPRMWIDALNVLFSRLKSSDIQQNAIRSISVSGQQHGLVALDKSGNLSRPGSKLWNDFSTQEECDVLTEKIGGHGAMISEVGNSQRTGYTASKIFHMVRHEREHYERSATLFLVHNYINWYLTGAENGGICVMEPGDTSGTALWNPATRQWSQKVIDAIDPGLRAKLPAVKPSDKSIGTISEFLIQQYGFSHHCSIDAGSGDNMYGAIGTGNVENGTVTVSLGTSGTAYAFTDKPYVDPTGEIAAFCDSTGNYLPLLCVSNLANGYNSVLQQHSIGHDEFNSIIRKTPAGNGGRLLIPWFTGERTPDIPNASPLYFGFQLEEFTKMIMCRAVLEGHILNLYNGFLKMSVEPGEIRLTGGLSHSESWCQTIADIFETEVVPVEGEGAALGAAIHAAWVWYKESGEAVSLQELVAVMVRLDEKRRTKPIDKNTQVHRVQKRLFADLCSQLKTSGSENIFDLRRKFI